MNFASDNWAGVADPIAKALFDASSGLAAAYGTSDLDQTIEAKFSEIFERDVAVYFVGTGTAANALSMCLINKPGGVVFCHEAAHIIADECGAVETMTGGARLYGVKGKNGKIDPEHLIHAIDRYPPDFVHGGQPMAVSITQATEAGTRYTIEDIKALSEICKAYHLPLHMDGARFANALASLQVSPAEMTWKAGVDVMSFGATKNGCWCAEAIIVFNKDLATQMPYLRKRAAHLFSKTRFISTQLKAYFENNLWLDLAERANKAAQFLSQGIQSSDGCDIAHPVEANEVFAILPQKIAKTLQAEGAIFYPWPHETCDHPIAADKGLYRFVTSFRTQDTEIKEFLEKLETLTQA